MAELLSRFGPGEIIGLVAVAGGLFCGLTSIVMGVWYANRRGELVAALKQNMLDRGMSAEEIRTVMEAGAGSQDCQSSRKDLKASYTREV